MGSLVQLEKRPHIVVFSYPSQGHINPAMEFAKRLVCKNVQVTFIVSEKARERMMRAQESAAAPLTTASQDIMIETISDGLSEDFEKKLDMDLIFDLLRKVGGKSFAEVIERLNNGGERVSCIVYDSLIEWVPHIAKKFNIPSAFFWTQSCAVYSIYYHFYRGIGNVRNKEGNLKDVIEIQGLPKLFQSEMPSFIQPSNTNGGLFRMAMNQFSTISEATWVLGNSFSELETTEIQSMDSHLPLRTVGPLLPSAFLDGNDQQDQDVCTHLWKSENCITWLNSKRPSTVVYVSFGSLAVLSKEQIIEIALGLKASNYFFLWVIRPNDSKEINDFLEGFLEETKDQGLVVSWCQQIAVLSNPAVGMFVTHCGWNSTLESLSSGLPVLTLSQWSDQPTNCKYIEEVWKTGIKLNRVDGLASRDEVEKSIKRVMESDECVEMRKNALKWKTLAKKATVRGGDSDNNIDWFIHQVVAKTTLDK